MLLFRKKTAKIPFKKSNQCGTYIGSRRSFLIPMRSASQKELPTPALQPANREWEKPYYIPLSVKNVNFFRKLTLINNGVQLQWKMNIFDAWFSRITVFYLNVLIKNCSPSKHNVKRIPVKSFDFETRHDQTVSEINSDCDVT